MIGVHHHACLLSPISKFCRGVASAIENIKFLKTNTLTGDIGNLMDNTPKLGETYYGIERKTTLERLTPGMLLRNILNGVLWYLHILGSIIGIILITLVALIVFLLDQLHGKR